MLFYKKENHTQEINWVNVIVLVVVVITIINIFSMAILPPYRVWEREMKGRAELAEAEWSKRVQIEEALANLEAEKLNAKAEVERAKGMAEAISIEGGMLTDKYIQYLWVKRNQSNEKTVIYIPTEANLPILEAGRIIKDGN